MEMEKRTATVAFRVTDYRKLEFRAEAAREQMPLSGWLSRAVENELERARRSRGESTVAIGRLEGPCQPQS